MKRTLHILAAVLAGLTALGAADLSGIVSLLPEGWAGWVAGIPPLALALGHTVAVIGDLADDGQRNNSFPPN